MTYAHSFTKVGKTSSQIPVHISYRIIQLFSEGLYQSPNKAIEELVANAYDADARKVHVILSPDRAAEDAIIAVIDDGTGMDADGLRQHWFIGESSKRDRKHRRKQIGKFGIGKLATFVLAHHLTHITKKGGKYFAVTMDFRSIPTGDGKGIQLAADEKVLLPLRTLTEEQAKEALVPGLTGTKPGFRAIRLFGLGAAPTWTVAIMSDLKEMARELKKGRLTWVLRTAMPIQDDFGVYLDGEELKSATIEQKTRLKRWVLGKDIKQLEDPAPTELEVSEDSREEGFHRFGLTHPSLGRITGYAEVYEDFLTEGKAAEFGRSHGFFIYVRNRLINLEDALFGLPALRHGTFNRFRAVIHIDRLDKVLRSSRETVMDSPLVLTAREILHAIFNVARVWLEANDAKLRPDELAVKRISASASSLTGRPVLNTIAAAFAGKYSPRYITVPPIVSKKEQAAFLESLRERADSDAGLVTSLELVERGQQYGLATFDVQSGILKINAFHPFVAANLDDYEKRRETFGLLAMADVLTEAYLYQEGVAPAAIHEILSRRDDLLRQFARSLPRTAAMVAQGLEDASCEEALLEKELVACFDSMGFEAVHVGGKKKPDGKADAFLGTQSGRQVAYSVSLEAKSKQETGKPVSAKDIGISAVARHREDYSCDHAVVVAPDFPTADGEDSAVIKEARADREACRNRANKGKGKDATITLVRIHDLAELVRLVSLKFVSLDRIREFLSSCITPEESAEWIKGLKAEATPSYQIGEILEAIWEEQKDDVRAEVEFGSVRTALRKGRGISISPQDLRTVCNSLAQFAPALISIRPGYVSLRQRPDKVLVAVREAIPKPKSKGS